MAGIRSRVRTAAASVPTATPSSGRMSSILEMGKLRTGCLAGLAGNTADFQRTFWDPLNSSSICGMIALPWDHRPPKSQLPVSPHSPEKPCLLQVQSSSPRPARGRGGPHPRARPRQHARAPVRDPEAPCRAVRPATYHATGEAFPAPRLTLCATPPPTHDTWSTGFSPAETHAAWHVWLCTDSWLHE